MEKELSVDSLWEKGNEILLTGVKETTIFATALIAAASLWFDTGSTLSMVGAGSLIFSVVSSILIHASVGAKYTLSARDLYFNKKRGIKAGTIRFASFMYVVQLVAVGVGTVSVLFDFLIKK